MSLLRSFTHNVVIHPLLFVRDVAEQAGLTGIAVLLSHLHDRHELGEIGGLHHEIQPGDTEVPPQHPWTEQSESLVYRPRPAIPPPPERPLPGSIAARRGRARGNVN